MKSTGIVRKVDELGRIVLPAELRRTLNIAEKDPLEIYVDGDSVILRKHEDRCIFCESKEHILAFQGKHICLKCLAQLKKPADKKAGEWILPCFLSAGSALRLYFSAFNTAS